MALFGSFTTLKQQADQAKFATAFAYLQKALQPGSTEYNRLHGLPLNTFEKIVLDGENFALEQTYKSKQRNDCFFESHKRYIDVQCIVEGEEIIEVAESTSLMITMPYQDEMDLIKYYSTDRSSHILLKKGDIAIFYPEDAHMPCIQTDTSDTVIKTVVKVSV